MPYVTARFHDLLPAIAAPTNTKTQRPTYTMMAIQNQLLVYPTFAPILKNQNICDRTGKINVIMAAKKPLSMKANIIVHTCIMIPNTYRIM